MASPRPGQHATHGRVGGGLPGRFWLYWAGQTVSETGSAFTTFALPLLVFRLTGSPTDLGATTALAYLPWLLFGLPAGALMDRLDRRRVMVVTDLARALVVCVLPALAAAGALRLDWIYAVTFLQASLQTAFSSGTFTAVVALVDPEVLVTANSRLEAGNSGGQVAGSALAGLLVAVAPVSSALWVDGASFAVSALSLALVGGSFNSVPPAGLRGGGARRAAAQLSRDIRAGVVYVARHPVLRDLSAQLALVNLFGSMVTAEAALCAVTRLGASNAEVGWLYAASGLGVVALSFTVGSLGRRLPLRTMTFTALLLYAGGIAGFGFATAYPAGLLAWAVMGGATVLYNVSTATLRQRLVPNELLGRVWNIALVTAWCAIPLGAVTGGLLVAATHRVGSVFVGDGTAIALVALLFRRRAGRWPPAADRRELPPESR